MFKRSQEKMLDILKWTATATLIVGFGLMSAGITEGWYLQITGGIIWLTAAVIMKDKALMVTNGAMTTVGIIGKLFG
jgi:hypothetical protein